MNNSSDLASLKAMQQWMLNSLMFPGQVKDSDINQRLKSTDKLPAKKALSVYQYSYYSRLLTCLSEQYPALTYCLGRDVFDAFAEQYLFEYPSNSYTLYQLGKRFPEYLQQTRPDKDSPEVWIDFMIELADFELNAFSLFEAKGDEGNLATKPVQPTLSSEYRLQRCLTLYKSQFPVADYYCQVRDAQSPKLPDCLPSYTALVRVAYCTRIVYLKPLEFEFIQMWQHTDSLPVAINNFANKQTQLNQHQLNQTLWQSGGWLERWLDHGFLIAEHQSQ